MGTGVLGYTRPCRVAGKALLSPVEIKHRMGMGREGVWQQPAAGSGRGLGGRVLLCPPGGFACSAAPTYQGLHSTAARVGCPTAGSSKAPVVPVLRGASSLQPRPRTRKHRVLGWTPGAAGRGGSSHFTLFREYEFTCKSRGWAPSRPPSPLAVETGSRSCTKWEWRGVRDPEQPARGVTGCAFGWEAADQESWGCRNLLKTPRLFFP